jgi:hypothetical protein
MFHLEKVAPEQLRMPAEESVAKIVRPCGKNIAALESRNRLIVGNGSSVVALAMHPLQ